MNNDIITYEPENYNSVLMEEYLFESAIKDTYFGKDSSNLYFDIRPRERDKGIPHVHVCNILKADKYEKRSKKYFECCIRLKSCNYWNHEPWMRKIPNQKLKDKIVKFLNSKNADTQGLSVWEFLKNQWLSSYFDYELKHIKRIPNYDNLPTGN